MATWMMLFIIHIVAFLFLFYLNCNEVIHNCVNKTLSLQKVFDVAMLLPTTALYKDDDTPYGGTKLIYTTHLWITQKHLYAVAG